MLSNLPDHENACNRKEVRKAAPWPVSAKDGGAQRLVPLASLPHEDARAQSQTQGDLKFLVDQDQRMDYDAKWMLTGGLGLN